MTQVKHNKYCTILNVYILQTSFPDHIGLCLLGLHWQIHGYMSSACSLPVSLLTNHEPYPIMH